jgi:hypothetical protein
MIVVAKASNATAARAVRLRHGTAIGVSSIWFWVFMLVFCFGDMQVMRGAVPGT